MSGRAFPFIHTWFQQTAPYLLLAALMWHSTTIVASTIDRPNIILFLVDDMGWQDTSVPFWDRATPFNKHFRTPNMERLEKQGRRFTQAYACAVCSPTRTSIMTGQNAARHRVTNWTLYEDRETSGTTPRLLPPQNRKKAVLQPSASPTLPQVLRDDLGYRTIHVGKATGTDEPMLLPNELIVPGKTWEERSAHSAGLNETLLANIPTYLKGRGMIVKDGYRVFSWGDVNKPGDVASAAKPLYTHFLAHAVETGRLESFDQKVTDIRPELGSINANLEHKDRQMTFAHLANQTACYGVSEAPGTAYDYNDWQMALFWDSLFEGVYSVHKANVDDVVFHPMLTDLLQFEDPVSMLAFGEKDRAGRLKISPRDFCRFGWLYLMEGRWGNQRIIRPEHVRMLTQSPLPNSLPRTKGIEADMLPNQRTIGSRRIPDNQTDHYGSYSWLWWINGKRENGKRFWPDAPEGAFACLGHQHGMRGMVVIPEWRMVMSWNDTELNKKPWPDPQTDPHPLNPVFQWIGEALKR